MTPKPDALTLQTRFVRAPGALDSRMDDTLFVLHTAGGACIAFTGPSARLWALLADPIDAVGAARQLVREYDVEEAACARQVLEHFRSLWAEGLIAPADPAA